VLLAYYLRSYWALVYGMIAGACINVVVSYLAHPFRPKLSLKKFKTLWSFSSWMIVLNVGMFLAQQGDRYIVGSQLPATEVGLYTTSAELAELPTTELLFPITTTLFPGFAKIQHERERLRAAFNQIIAFVSGLIIPLGVGLSLVAEEFILLFMGEKWRAAIPLLQVLALFGVCRAVYILPRNILVVLKKEKIVAAMAWLNAIVFLSLAYFTLTHHDLMTMIIVKVIVAIGFAILGMFMVMRIVGVERSSVVSSIYRPILAGAVMVLTVSSVLSDVALGIAFILGLKIVLGAVTYTSVLLTLWWLKGKPDGFESFVIELLSRLARQLFARVGAK